MKCGLLKNNLIGYLENTLSEDVRLQLEKHLEQCATCQKLYQEVRSTYNAWDNLAEPELNPFFYTRLEQKLKNRYQHQANIPVLVWKFRAVVTGFLLVISIGFGVFIGKNISVQNTSFGSREEVLQTYASDYYLTSTSEENEYTYTMNE